jgi:hypothetical protein
MVHSLSLLLLQQNISSLVCNSITGILTESGTASETDSKAFREIEYDLSAYILYHKI